MQTVPAWMGSSVIQPVAVADAVWFLAEAVERPDVTGHLDVVGPDRLSYVSLLRTYAARARLLRVQVPVWLAPVEAVARVAGALVDVPSGTVESLIPSLGHDMVAERDAADVLGEPPGGRLGSPTRCPGRSRRRGPATARRTAPRSTATPRRRRPATRRGPGTGRRSTGRGRAARGARGIGQRAM